MKTNSIQKGELTMKSKSLKMSYLLVLFSFCLLVVAPVYSYGQAKVDKKEAEIKKLEDAIASNNTDNMKSATESLNKVWSEMASQLYQQPGPGAPQQPGDSNQSGPSDQSGKPEDKNVQDASYEVVDEEKDKDKKK